MRNLKKIIFAGAALLSLYGCESLSPSSFVTLKSPLNGGHIEQAIEVCLKYHGGAVGFGNDIDIDYDGMSDEYVICEDNTFFATSSRRLLSGEDTITRKTWENFKIYEDYKNTPGILRDYKNKGIRV